MGRWEPDAQGRLLSAALELFAEHGYEATTTAQIAERAGLTKTTLFRLFSDKREIVFQGQSALVELVRRGVSEAPMGANPSELMAGAIGLLSRAHTEDHRRTGRILDPVLAESPELNERAVFKRFTIASTLEKALADRGVEKREAGILADLGVRAYYSGYELWVASDSPSPLADYVADELSHLEEAATILVRSSAEPATAVGSPRSAT